jgi:hypothetical protein
MTKANDKYDLVPDLDGTEDAWCIRLKQEPFAGVIYKYGKVKLQINEEKEDHLTAKFVYDILVVPDELRERTFEDEVQWEFEKLIGDILMDIVQQSIDNSEVTETQDEDGNLTIKRKVTF